MKLLSGTGDQNSQLTVHRYGLAIFDCRPLLPGIGGKGSIAKSKADMTKKENWRIQQVHNFSCMKRSTLIILLCTAIMLNGCLYTLYPIFTEKDIIFNKDLLGYWKVVNEKQSLEIKRIPENRKAELPEGIRRVSVNGYLVIRIDSSGKVMDENFVFLSRIGKHNYLDYYPAETPAQKTLNKYYKNHLIGLHSIYRCDVRNTDQFGIRQFDKKFLDKQIQNNKINIRHEVIDGKNIITAPTDQLQQFIIQYSDNPAAFMGITNYVRVVEY